ncbi:MAG: radical SAM protein [Thermodesulfobacteriota bacterium]
MNRAGDLMKILGKVILSRIHWRGPIILCHLVTGHFNCSCEPCLWRNNSSEDLTLDEIKKFYRDAKELGFLVNFIWGGEPLLREDIPEILRFSKEMGLVNVITTNGWFLEERLDEIAQYSDSLIISLDHPSDMHDVIRKKKGLFQRLMKGVQLIKRRYPEIKVMFNFLLTNQNKNAIEESINLAHKLQVSFYVCPMEIDLLRSGRMEGIKRHLKPSKEEEAHIAETLIQLKRKGFKVNNSYLYLESIKNGKKVYRCHFPKMVLQIGPEGEVIDCRAWDRLIGCIRRQSLREIFQHKRLQELAGWEGEQCNKCNNPNRIDLSYFWELRIEPVTSIFRMFLSE